MILNLNGFYSIFKKTRNSHSHLKCIKKHKITYPHIIKTLGAYLHTQTILLKCWTHSFTNSISDSLPEFHYWYEPWLAHFKLSVEVSSDWGETLSSFFWTDIREQICLFDPYSFESKIFMILKCIFFFRNRYQKTKIKTSKTWRRLIKFGPWSWFSHGTNRSWKAVL